MATILITGANRGLGLEFARQYLAAGDNVIATCRNPAKATALRALKGSIEIKPLDVISGTSIQALRRSLASVAIDVLLLNAAVNLQKDGILSELDPELWMDEFETNVIAPIMLARALAENVARSEKKRIVSISSDSGSITNIKMGGNYAYRSSKSAVNSAMRMLSFDFAARGITVVSIGPGHTRTDMGGDDAPHPVEDSVTKVRNVIAKLTAADSGKFLSRDGAVTPW